jgi:hypothetical protein
MAVSSSLGAKLSHTPGALTGGFTFMAQRVVDHGDSKKYFTQIPNVVFTLGLSPYALTLYCHLKRAAGANANGRCWKSTATLARETKMGAGSVSRAKDELQRDNPLLSTSLIKISEEANPNGGKPKHCISLTDIWPQNTRLMQASSTVEAEDRHVPEGNVQVPTVNFTSSPGEIKKNSLEEEPSKEDKEPTAHTRLMNFLSLKIGPIPNGAKEGKAIKWLLENGYDPGQCEACFVSLAADDWRTSAVTWVTVKANIGAWLARDSNGHKPKQTASERNVTNMKDSLDYLNNLGDERLLTR